MKRAQKCARKAQQSWAICVFLTIKKENQSNPIKKTSTDSFRKRNGLVDTKRLLNEILTGRKKNAENEINCSSPGFVLEFGNGNRPII